MSCVQDEPEITNESDDESGSNEEMPNLEAMDLEAKSLRIHSFDMSLEAIQRKILLMQHVYSREQMPQPMRGTES